MYSSRLRVATFWLASHVEGLMHPLLFCSQRTYSHQASLTLTWALNWKWWSALEQPPCFALPVATLTQKSPGTRTSCPLTPVRVMAGSNSYAQVRKAQPVTVIFHLTDLSTWLFLCFVANVAAVSPKSKKLYWEHKLLNRFMSPSLEHVELFDKKLDS